MKLTSIRVKEDLARRLNLMKYQLGYKNHDEVIRKLIELSLKVTNTPSSLNIGSEPLFDDSLSESASSVTATNTKKRKNVTRRK